MSFSGKTVEDKTFMATATMRLSDAIALGRMLVAPRPRAEYRRDGSGCARGMALEGAGIGRIISLGEDNERRFVRFFPWTRDARKVPCNCRKTDTVADTIAHIFDHHVCDEKDWTLDQLIDWVRSVEPAEPEPAIAESLQVAEEVSK